MGFLFKILLVVLAGGISFALLLFMELLAADLMELPMELPAADLLELLMELLAVDLLELLMELPAADLLDPIPILSLTSCMHLSLVHTRSP